MFSACQEARKRQRGGGKGVLGGGPPGGKRARLEPVDTSGLGSQNPEAGSEEEARTETKQDLGKDRTFVFKASESRDVIVVFQAGIELQCKVR